MKDIIKKNPLTDSPLTGFFIIQREDNGKTKYFLLEDKDGAKSKSIEKHSHGSIRVQRFPSRTAAKDVLKNLRDKGYETIKVL